MQATMKTRGLQSAGRTIFLVFLGLNGILQFMLGIFMLFNWQEAVETMMAVTYIDDMAIFGVPIGLNLLMTAFIIALSIQWTRQGKQEGIILGTAFGVLSISAGLMTFVQFGMIENLAFDFLRGLLIVVSGIFATHSLETSGQ